MSTEGTVGPLPEEEVKKVVDTWVDVIKTPLLSGGYIREDDNFLNVVTKWSVTDAAKKEGVSFVKTITVLKSSLENGAEKPVLSTSAPVTIDEKLALPTKSGNKRVVLVEKAGSGGSSEKSEFLQIWDENTLLKSYNLGELDLHKQVYTSAGWGITMTWNEDGTKLAYLAEKKVPKGKPFYSTAAAKTEKEGEKKEDEKKPDPVGEEYAFKQTWGEQLTGQYYSVIVVLDLATDKFKVLDLPEDQFPTDIQWIGDSHICGTTYPIPYWRVGLIFCSNRESQLFSVQADGDNFQLLTPSDMCSRSARVSPNGKYLLYQQRKLDGAHGKVRSVWGVSLSNGGFSGTPQLVHSEIPENQIPVYDDFQRHCWSPDGSVFYALGSCECEPVCLAFTITPDGTTSQIRKVDLVNSIFAITKDYLLTSVSNTVTSPELRLLDISNNYQPVTLTQGVKPVEYETIQQLVHGECSPPSVYAGPTIESVPPNSVPLVVIPHGGPHSHYMDTFGLGSTFFLKLGFAVLKLNYVGSTGGTRDTTDDLLGRAGDKDVKDCQGIVEKLLNSMPCLNPDKVAVWGGSHGGFLGAHLSGQYPDSYKAAVLLNPVTDLATMVGTTDITDWVYAEAGVPLPRQFHKIIPTPKSSADLDKYIKASPIHLADKVKGATLLLLGSEDLRVPAQQGLSYYRALRSFNKIAEVRMYPDCHSLAKGPHELDMIIHSALWLKRFLR